MLDSIFLPWTSLFSGSRTGEIVGSVTASVLVGGGEVCNLPKNAIVALAECAVKVILREFWRDEIDTGIRSEMFGDGQQDP